MRPTRAVIHLSAIEHNLEIIKKLAPKSKIMAVVKADAYGHGLVPTAEKLSGADALAVACIEEALELRQGGINEPIVLLEGVFASNELPIVEKHGFEMVIHNRHQLNLLECYQASKPLNIWLKYDSNMHRLGFNAEEFVSAYAKLDAMNIKGRIRLMTHYACADDIHNDMTLRQFKSFQRLLSDLSKEELNVDCLQCETSTANSAAVLAWPETHGDWVRPGLLLYGASPLIDGTGKGHGLRPAMTLESQLISIKPISKGESVGYGAAWTAARDTTIGIVAIGYGDGYPRHAKNGTPVWLNGRLVALAGRVSMDMIAVDLGPHSTDHIGDRVVLWGDELPIELVASWSDTIAYTLMCGVTARVSYHWHD